MAEEDTKYDPEKSSVTSDTFDAWMARPLSGSFDTDEVPGLPAGGGNLDILKEGGYTTVFQLFGKFLSLRGDDVSSTADQCQAFYTWLAGKGIVSNRNTIVRAVSLKVAVLFPSAP
eukprot:PLAT5870.1.p2 GENE.PLAT5870.1~~PLAT5870.1.p2  ORF type:complete len:116 (-),score=59.16 PLAT5870.1:201-548(-)